MKKTTLTRPLTSKMNDTSYKIVKIKEAPSLTERAASWFHDKWKIPKEAYLASMEASINGDDVQEWYLLMDGDDIIGGMGVIENDFHDRKDLAPNICAVYIEEDYRGQGLAGDFLTHVVEDNRQKGISPIYLFTDHIGYYERYGWVFETMALGDDGKPSRIYVHH